ncbi:hypothetical protein Aperf_G00000069044 [Anoplocephala perfoliata]
MGKNRRNRKNARRKRNASSDTEELIKFPSDIAQKPLRKRLKNKERRKRLKKGKVDFVNHCLELKHAEPIAEQVYDLPPSQPPFTPSPEVAAQVFAFLTRRMYLLERKEDLSNLSEFYCSNSSVSIHAAPFIKGKYEAIMDKNSANRKDCKNTVAVDAMLPYVIASSNLLKGSWPLPSWALDFGGKETNPKLDKIQRKSLQVIRKMQEFNFKYFRRQSDRVDLSGISHYKSTHSTVIVAEGLCEIKKLFEFVPSLVTIRSDSSSSYDIIDYGPSGICLQYRTLCLEMPGEQSTRNKLPLLLRPPLVRWVQRTVVLVPPPAMKIVNEIICVIPVSEEHEAKYANVIRDAIDGWVSSLGKTASTSNVPMTEECDKAMKVSQLSSATGMNRTFSEQCLNECDWNINLALEAFHRVQAAGTLPDDAFSQDML